MKRFLVLFFVTATAQAACDYTIRDRMLRTPEQQRQFRCELNWRCINELERLAIYSRDNRCNDELRLADLMTRQMSQAAPGECSADLTPADMQIEQLFTVSNVMANECGPNSPREALSECRSAGFSCTLEEEYKLNNREECSLTVKGKKSLPDTDAGKKEARCLKLMECVNAATFFADNESVYNSKMQNIERLQRQHGCPTMDEAITEMNVNESGRETNHKTDLPVIQDAPSEATRTSRQ